MSPFRLHFILHLGLLSGALLVATVAKASPAADHDPAQRPFAPDSPWNTPLGAASAIESADSPCSRVLVDEKLAADVNAAQWSHPIYLSAATDPQVKVIVKGELVATLRIPKSAEPAKPRSKDSDAHLHIIDPERRYVHELWHARRKSDRMLADGYTKNDLSGPGVGEGGERAYGGSAIGGLIRRRELTYGILHALAMALPRTHLKLGPVWPATKQDDGAESSYRGAVPMGQLVTLTPKPNLDALALSPEGKVLARALTEYGAYVVDASSDLTFYAEPSAEPDLQPLRADLVKLRPLLRCVAHPAPLGPATLTGKASATVPKGTARK